jgi:hypothetical protein
MAVHEQPSIRDYWSYQTEALHCKEVAGCLSRNRFQYILKCLHVARKTNLVYEKKGPRYDPLGQVRWLLDRLIKNFQAHWNGFEYLCVDESMVLTMGSSAPSSSIFQ